VKFFNLNSEGVKFTRQRTIEEMKAFIEEQLAEVSFKLGCCKYT